MKFYRKPKKKSEKKKLRDAIGEIDLQILKIKRGDKCEIHNQKCGVIGRLHILNVGRYPNLEFSEINIILSAWFCSHFYLHHNSDDPRAIEAKRRICELRGHEKYEDLLIELKKLHATMPKHNIGYLQLLYHAKQRELENLKALHEL